MAIHTVYRFIIDNSTDDVKILNEDELAQELLDSILKLRSQLNLIERRLKSIERKTGIDNDNDDIEIRF